MGYKVNLPHKNGYPGEGYYYTLCDVCDKKIRAKDAILIKDKYNPLNNMTVCKEDADETNPLSIPKKPRREQGIRNPAKIREPGTPKYVFIDTPEEIETGVSSNPTGRIPSVPRFLFIIEATTSSIELMWEGPEDPGTPLATGYKIERESPVGGGFSTIKANTGTVAQYYKDTTTSAGTQYNYRVSVINEAGTSSPSNEAAASTPSS